MGNSIFISPIDLYVRIGTATAPILLDVRRTTSFDADETPIVGAIRHDPDSVAAWQRELPRNRPVVVYCVHGQEVSQRTAAALRAIDIDAVYLDGEITGWAELGRCRRRKAPASTQGWITRERPKIDRIACPWLIRRFVDPEAEFLLAPTEQVFDIAEATGTTAYDIPGAEPFSHDGEACSFDALPPGLRDQRSGARCACTDRSECRHRAPGACRAITRIARAFAWALGQFPEPPRDARTRDGVRAFYAWCRSCQEEKPTGRQPRYRSKYR